MTVANRNDDAMVDAFVAYLQQHGYPDLAVDRRPDQENRKTSDIDAIAGKFAIEHRSVDTIDNQRGDSARFVQVALPLEAEFRNSLAFRLEIFFPYAGIAKGHGR